MRTRRIFLQSLAGSVAALPGRAKDRIRIGMIGPGYRGIQLLDHIVKSPRVECVAVADVYTKRLDEARRMAPSAKPYSDYRYLLDDQSIDAVFICTPPHLHCEHFIAALEAGKHVYQEKTMAFSVDHAKRMRAAYGKVAGKLTVQIGHQDCSSGQIGEAAGWVEKGLMGKIMEIHSHMYRNTPHDRPQWTRPLTPDMTPQSIRWEAFLGGAPRRPFDANRFINWRFFWDYSGGNFYENMCHQMAFWYKVLNLRIPTSVCANGGVFLWKDGREVPDAMNASMRHPEEMLFNWDSAFGNNQLSTSEDILGTDGTILRREFATLDYLPQKVNRRDATPLGGQSVTDGQSPLDELHIQNFLDCIALSKEPNCPFDIGFRVSIACRMAVDSFRQGRFLHWDAAREEIA